MNLKQFVIFTLSTTLLLPICLSGCTPKMPKNGIDAKNKIIYLDTAFGSNPNDDKDDAPALRKAFAYLLGKVGWTIKLSEGKYIISPESKSNANSANKDYALREWVQSCFYYQGLKGIKIVGNKTTFELSDPLTGAFTFINCKDISVSGITFDMAKMPWVQGKITEVNAAEGYFVLNSDEGYDILDDERCIKIYDKLKENKHITGNVYVKAGRLKESANDHFLVDSYKKIGERSYKFYTDKSYINKNFIDKDDLVVINCRTGGSSTFEFLAGTTNVILKDITIYAGAGSGVLGTDNNGSFTVDNFNILRKPDSGRLVSTQMDGLHYQGLKGPAKITDCTFEGMMDDAINFYQSPISITKIINKKAFIVKHARHLIKADETLTFYNASKGTSAGTAKVITADVISGTEVQVTLDKELNDVTLSTIAYTDASNFNGSIIKNCVFREFRGSGIMARGNNITIEDNLFKDFCGIGIDMQNYTTSEGPWATNITIKNNTFDGIAYLAAYSYLSDVRLAPINIRSTNSAWGYGKDKMNSNIVIEKNTFKNISSTYLIHMSEATDCKIIDNDITMASIDSMPVFYRSVNLVDTYPIYIKNSSNITVTGNKITDLRSWTKGGIKVISSDNVIDENNEIKLK